MKQELWPIEVATTFRSNNFRDIEAMKMIFSSKYSKFYVDLENAIKSSENQEGFEDDMV